MPTINKPDFLIQLKPLMYGIRLSDYVDDQFKPFFTNYYVDITLKNIFYFNGDVIQRCQKTPEFEPGEFFFIMKGFGLSNITLLNILKKNNLVVDEVGLRYEKSETGTVFLNNGVECIPLDSPDYSGLYVDSNMNFWTEYLWINHDTIVPTISIKTEPVIFDSDDELVEMVKRYFDDEHIRRKAFRIDDVKINLSLMFNVPEKFLADKMGNVYLKGSLLKIVPDHNDVYYLGRDMFVSKELIISKLNPKVQTYCDELYIELSDLLGRWVKPSSSKGWFIDANMCIWKSYQGMLILQPQFKLGADTLIFDNGDKISLKLVEQIFQQLRPL